MNHNPQQGTVTDGDLQKSVESLMALLETEAPMTGYAVDGEESMEKSMNHAAMPTNGGLAAYAGAPPLDPQLDQTPAQPEGELEDDMADEAEDNPMSKSYVQGDEAYDEQAADEDFAKSLAAAFIESEELVDAARESEFAKSLVLGTIEGLSIAHEELTKSMGEFEFRQDEKIKVLAKGLAAIAKAVDEIRSQVVAVSNAPSRSVAKSARVLEKSFGVPEGANPDLAKSMILKALDKRVQEGKVDAFQLVKYETTGVIDPALAREIQSELGL